MSTKFSISIYCETLPAMLAVAALLKNIPDTSVMAETQTASSEVPGAETEPKRGPGRPKKAETAAAPAPAPAPAAAEKAFDPLADEDDEPAAAATATFEEAFAAAKALSETKGGGDKLISMLKEFGAETIGKLKKLPGAEDGTLFAKVLARAKELNA